MKSGTENCYIIFLGWTSYNHGTFSIAGDIVKGSKCVASGGFNGDGGPGGYGCGYLIYSIELTGQSGKIYPEQVNRLGEGDYLYYLCLLE